MGARPSRQSAFTESVTTARWLQPIKARVGQWIGAGTPTPARPAAEAGPKDSGLGTARPKGLSDLKATRKELAALLNQHPQARRVVPHLAHVAIRLRDADLGALHALPPDVAARACQQLATLAGDCAGQPGLRALHQRLLLVSRPAASSGPVTSMSAFGGSSALGLGLDVLVEEGSLDAFEQEERAWSDTHDPGVPALTR